MRARELFEEESYKTYGGDAEVMNLAKTTFLKYFQKFPNPAIYRGSFDRGATYWIVNPAAVGRASANTSNEYTILMSELPSWKAYPKRSRSIICTTDSETAESYGQIYAVVLPNRFNLGICYDNDLWDSFTYLKKRTGSSAENFNDAFGSLIEATTGESWSAEKGHTLADIKEKAAIIQQWLVQNFDKAPPHKKELARLFKITRFFQERLNESSPPDALFKMIEALFDPDRNQFERVTSLSKLPTYSTYGSREVWTDTPCLLIEAASYRAFRERVLK